MSKTRMIRINDEIQREISVILRAGISDPRFAAGIMASCVRAEVSRDLKYCKAYISILGTDEQKAAAMEAIKSAHGHIRSSIARGINLRNTPEFKFILDDSLDHSFRINEILAGDRDV